MRYQSALLATLLLASQAYADDLPDTQRHDFPVAGMTLHIPPTSSVGNTLPAGILFDYWSPDKSLGMNATIAPINNPSPDQYASMLAIQLRGIKEPWDEKIDGQPAFRINATVKMDKCTARTSLVAVHGGRALVITAFGADSDKSEEAARQLARTASFSDPESPAEHTDFSPKVGFAFGEPAARVVISAPEWLHVAKSAGKQLTLSGFDFVTGKDAFIAAFTYTDVPEALHVAEYAVRMLPQIKSRFNAKETELWSALPENSKVYVTGALHPTQENAGQPSLFRLALVEVAPGHILSMVFMINTEDAVQAKAYADLSGAIVKNIKIASTPAPPRMAMPAGPQLPAQAAAQEK